MKLANLKYLHFFINKKIIYFLLNINNKNY